MKNYLILIAYFALMLFSCTSKNTTTSTDTLKVASQPEQAKEPLKTLKEVKLTLLDGRFDKADILLGKPDKYGKLNLTANLSYMVYFDKVLDENIKKHLVLIIDNNEEKTIGVDAVSEGNIERWGLRNFTVSRTGLKSDGADFTVESNTPTDAPKQDNSTKVITKLDDLPNPADVVKNGQAFTIMNYTQKQIYEWYVQHYKAKLHDNTLHFYINLDEGDLVAQSSMEQRGNNVLLNFVQMDTSSQ